MSAWLLGTHRRGVVVQKRTDAVDAKDEEILCRLLHAGEGSVRVLKLAKMPLTAPLCSAIGASGSLQTLTLSGNPLSGAPGEHLSKALEVIPTLRSLRAEQCSLNDADLKRMVEALLRSDRRTLTELRLASNDFTSAEALASMFHFEWPLRILSLDGNDLGTANAVALLDAAAGTAAAGTPSGVSRAVGLGRSPCSLRVLNLWGVGLGNGGAVAVARLLTRAPQLFDVRLGFNSITEDGAVALAAALPRSSLHSLRMSGNRISDRGAVAIAEALRTAWSVVEVELSNNDIGLDGAVAIATTLATSHTLRVLDLSHNRLGSKAGGAALGKSLRENRSLDVLVLSSDGRGLDTSGQNEFLDADIYSNHVLEVRGLGAGPLTDFWQRRLRAQERQRHQHWRVHLWMHAVRHKRATQRHHK